MVAGGLLFVVIVNILSFLIWQSKRIISLIASRERKAKEPTPEGVVLLLFRNFKNKKGNEQFVIESDDDNGIIIRYTNGQLNRLCEKCLNSKKKNELM